jgi:hypothetical protein
VMNADGSGMHAVSPSDSNQLVPAWQPLGGGGDS